MRFGSRPMTMGANSELPSKAISRECWPLSVFMSGKWRWLRGGDLNPRPLGYEPNELPDCSTPRHVCMAGRSRRSEHLNVTRGRGRVKGRALPAAVGVGGTDVPDDEQLLARLDQAELAAGDFLDRRGVFLQPSRFLPEPRVLAARPDQRLLQRALFVALLHDLDEPVVADQRIDHQHPPQEHEQVLHGPAPPAPPCRSARICCRAALFHSPDRGRISRFWSEVQVPEIAREYKC